MPDAAPDSANLVTKDFHGGFVANNETVKYECKRGMKFSGDFTQTETQTTCNTNLGKYEDITDVCVPSKLVTLLPFLIRHSWRMVHCAVHVQYLPH